VDQGSIHNVNGNGESAPTVARGWLATPAGLLALKSLPGVGPAGAIALAGRFADWDDLVRAGELERTKVAGKPAALVPGSPPAVVSSPTGIEVLGWYDDRYPSGLRTIAAPPAVLWLRGTLSQLPSIAIIGTRTPTDWGRRVARLIAIQASNAGFGVVSGLASGIDGEAHQAALEVSGHTVAVLGSGVDTPTPTEHTALANRIVSSGGALIAEVPPGSPSSERTLMARDRLQSGLASTVVVVQSDIPSGTLHTVRFCLAQHRRLAVVEPPTGEQRHPANEANMALINPAGCDPRLLGATGQAAELIRSRRPVADIVIHDREDLTPLWETLRHETRGGAP
jgi:DNA processing protein